MKVCLPYLFVLLFSVSVFAQIKQEKVQVDSIKILSEIKELTDIKYKLAERIRELKDTVDKKSSLISDLEIRSHVLQHYADSLKVLMNELERSKKKSKESKRLLEDWKRITFFIDKKNQELNVLVTDHKKTSEILINAEELEDELEKKIQQLRSHIPS
jgi:DNA repair ATPase RecN